MKVGGKEYTLVQYHFHAPSEHAFDGIRLPLEAHFVHKSKEGKEPVILPGAGGESLGICLLFKYQLQCGHGFQWSGVEGLLRRDAPAEG